MSKLLMSLSALTIAAASSLAMAQGTAVGAKADAGGTLSTPSATAPLNSGAAAGTSADANAAGSDIKADVKANAKSDTKGRKHAGHAGHVKNKGDSSAGLGTDAGAKIQ